MCNINPNQGNTVPGVQDPAAILQEKISEYNRALNAKEIVSFSIMVRGIGMLNEKFCSLHVASSDQVFYRSLLPQLIRILKLMADHAAGQQLELLTSNQKPE